MITLNAIRDDKRSHRDALPFDDDSQLSIAAGNVLIAKGEKERCHVVCELFQIG
jgi:uncharacterized protein with PhoU and TrkA domain